MLERTTKEGERPVPEINTTFFNALEYFETCMARRNLPVLTGKATYIPKPIVNKYREGKVKRTPERGVK